MCSSIAISSSIRLLPMKQILSNRCDRQYNRTSTGDNRICRTWTTGWPAWISRSRVWLHIFHLIEGMLHLAKWLANMCIFGYPCVSLGILVCRWVSLCIFGYPCVSLGILVYLWISLCIFGYPCVSLGILVYLWVPLCIFGYPCVSLDILVCLWVSLCICGYPCVSLDILVYLWVSLCVFAYPVG